jgi:serine phosphatase RsbU (regulator of sigma subunit)/integral membrane sensor domain MASE1/anti-sigma regulatory factor (Ser/Thr protein kinase)
MDQGVGGRTGRIAALVAVALAYYVGARLGLGLSLVADNVTPLWPPTGIAVAAFVLFGRSMWPAVAGAAFLVNLPISANPLAAGVTALGNLLAPLAAAVLLQRFGFRRQLDRQRDAHLVVLCALASGVVSATIGSATLVASGAIASDGFLGAWGVWWTGDTMGVLLVAPMLLAVPLFWEQPAWRLREWTEAGVICGCVGAVSLLGLRADLPVLFPMLPFLGLAAWRLQLRGAAPAALVASVATTWSAAHGIGTFSRGGLLAQMLTLQAFNASVALMSFFLAAVVTERRHTAALLLVAADQRREREHEIAVALQQTLLPRRLPATPGVEIAARYIPASSDMQVGGDWYDVVPLPGGRLGLVIGDVAGHGLEAAATMGQVRMAVRAYALQDPAPASVMTGLRQLAARSPGTTMTTLLYLLYDPASSIVRFANAGHPPALVVDAEGATFTDEAAAPPLAVSTTTSCAEGSLQLAPGATLVMYTDGLVERRGSSIQVGLDRLRAGAATLADAGVEAMCDGLLDLLEDPQTAEDDVALLVLRTHPLDGAPLHIEVPAEPAVLVQIRLAVRRWLRDAGVDDEVAGEVLIACGEACNNVVEHAYGGVPGSLELDVRMGAGMIEVVVRDHGEWRPEMNRGGGWGLRLARSVMDEVEVRRMRYGTEVVMRREARQVGPS